MAAPEGRKLLEACCRAPATAQGEVKRARIVLLAAAARSTRSIAKEVGVQPRVVSNWRRRFAEKGLGGLQDRVRGGKEPLYGPATNTKLGRDTLGSRPDAFNLSMTDSSSGAFIKSLR